ncbi:GD17981 [Drosophila simulans]|uniref:GD17981 n=1 Tax=Drosophila simulans TaxID=7240 RepID=B4R6S4_DROSI|nr:GD17981 [Drosophila simulans]
MNRIERESNRSETKRKTQR